MTFVPQRTASKIDILPLSAIKGYARNSRTHSEHQISQIVESIREFGFTNPILIDETNTIIAGHGRLAAAKKLSMATVPTVKLSGLTDAQKKAYVISDNKLALNAGWNIDALAAELRDLVTMDFNLDLLGFETSELTDMLMEAQEDLETGKGNKEEKFMLELQFPDRDTMLEKYEELSEAGYIVRAKNG